MLYDVFISYSRKDIDEAERLCQELDAAGVKYWIDRNIHGSANFLSEITKNIRQCKVVIFIASNNSANSEWTQKEILYALKRQKKIIPFRIGEFSFDTNDELDFVFSNVQWLENREHVVRDACELCGIDYAAQKQHHAEQKAKVEEQERIAMARAAQAEAQRREEEKRKAEEEARRKAEEQSRLREEKIRREEAEKQLRREQRQVRIEKIKKHAGAIVASILLIIGVISGFVVIKDWAAERKQQQIEAQTYKIGDYYNDGTKEGVVFDVWDGGKHGKIVSLEQKQLQWCTYVQYDKEIVVGATSKTDGKANTDKVMARADSAEYPAFVWCRDKGEDWYLPAIEELELLLLNDAVHDAVNKTLESRGAIKLFNKGELAWYWSSTECGEFCAWFVNMYYGSTNNYSKFYNSYVRAVSAF